MNYLKKPWYNDPRSKSFSHHALFGTATNLPVTLQKPLRVPEDQGNTQRCAAYAGAVNGGYIRGFRCSPDWQAGQISTIQGYSIDQGGSDPNAAMKSQVYPLGYVHFENQTEDPSQNGDAGYVKVDAVTTDTFDAIRGALYLAYDPVTKLGACVQAFGLFYAEWEHATIIPQAYSTFVGYHSYLFVDFTIENGISYLIAQNSYGTSMGNGGYHLFPREVINREFTLPNTTLKIPKPLTKFEISLAKSETPWGYIERQILKIWYTLSVTYGQITA